MLSRTLYFMMFVLLSLGLGGGCAGLAKKPPTPAAELEVAQLARLPAPDGERYFVMIFGSESKPKRAKYTHTWGSVIRVTDCESGSPKIEEHTISWMPATLEIRPVSRTVEPGVNLGLKFTIEEMLRNDEHVAMYGPYETGPGFYQRFLTQKAFMESGKVGYQCIDSFGEAARCGNGSDCIHAITDMDPSYSRNHYPLSFYGIAASRNVVREIHTRPVIKCPSADHSWLIPLLEIDKYKIERKTYTGPVVPNTPENVERELSKTQQR